MRELSLVLVLGKTKPYLSGGNRVFLRTNRTNQRKRIGPRVIKRSLRRRNKARICKSRKFWKKNRKIKLKNLFLKSQTIMALSSNPRKTRNRKNLKITMIKKLLNRRNSREKKHLLITCVQFAQLARLRLFVCLVDTGACVLGVLNLQRS